MSYSTTVTAVTNGTLSAAQWNSGVRDNFAALWVFTTAGDMIYATSSTGATRLAIGTSGYILSSSGSAPQWVANVKYMGFLLCTDTAAVVGDDVVRFRIPAGLNAWNITSVSMSRKSGTGIPTVQIRNVTDSVDVLSTKLTIDSGETDSSTAATAAVINTAVDDVATGDQFALDIDVAGTNTLYLWVEIGFAKP